MKYIPKLQLGNTIVQQSDATRTTPRLLYKKPIQKLNTPQDFARAASQRGTTVTDSLINLGGKPTEKKGNYWDVWGGRLGTNLNQLGNLGMGVAKTVGASAALATGMAYTPATVGTLGALGKGLLSGAVVDQGYSLLGGRPANIGEIGLGAGATMGMPLIGRGLAVPAFKILGDKVLTPAFKNFYRINPWAFKPNPSMYYRGIGESGVKDALASGVFRPKQGGASIPVQGSDGKIWEIGKKFSKTYYSPKFEIADRYGKGFIAEVPKNSVEFKPRYGRGKDWSMSTDAQIPITEGRVLQKDWLRGYKEIKPKIGIGNNADFKSIGEKYFNKINNKTYELENLHQSGKISYDDWLNNEKLYESEIAREFNFGKKLGQGNYGKVFEFSSNSDKVIKLGNPFGNEWTPEILNNLKTLKTGNIAIPDEVQYFNIPSKYKGYGPIKKELIVMPNLNKTNFEKLDLNPRDRYALFLKQARQLRDRGIKLDVDNLENIRFNPSKGVFDIYDVNPGYISNPENYMQFVYKKTKGPLLDNVMYKQGGFINKKE